MEHALPNLFILYVGDVAESAAFYGRLIGREPAFAAPSYVSFDLGSGFMLGLLSRASPAAAAAQGFELACMVGGPKAVDAQHRRWKALGIEAEEPFEAVFGRTFTASDPEGRMLRVCLKD